MEESGWDPDIKKYFRKILRSISVGLIWLMGCATAGIYYEWGFLIGKPAWQPILFYSIMLITGLLYLRYLFNIWKEK